MVVTFTALERADMKLVYDWSERFGIDVQRKQKHTSAPPQCARVFPCPRVPVSLPLAVRRDHVQHTSALLQCARVILCPRPLLRAETCSITVGFDSGG